MDSSIRTAAKWVPTAVGLVGLGAAGVVLLSPSTAGAAPTATTAAGTFQMYANVDAESDLGSNVDAVSAKPVPGANGYYVTFSKPIGSCAAVVQPGRAGGPDNANFVSSTVQNSGPKTFIVVFGHAEDDGQVNMGPEPFMLTVTCMK